MKSFLVKVRLHLATALLFLTLACLANLIQATPDQIPQDSAASVVNLQEKQNNLINETLRNFSRLLIILTESATPDRDLIAPCAEFSYHLGNVLLKALKEDFINYPELADPLYAALFTFSENMLMYTSQHAARTTTPDKHSTMIMYQHYIPSMQEMVADFYDVIELYRTATQEVIKGKNLHKTAVGKESNTAVDSLATNVAAVMSMLYAKTNYDTSLFCILQPRNFQSNTLDQVPFLARQDLIWVGNNKLKTFLLLSVTIGGAVATHYYISPSYTPPAGELDELKKTPDCPIVQNELSSPQKKTIALLEEKGKMPTTTGKALQILEKRSLSKVQYESVKTLLTDMITEHNKKIATNRKLLDSKEDKKIDLLTGGDESSSGSSPSSSSSSSSSSSDSNTAPSNPPYVDDIAAFLKNNPEPRNNASQDATTPAPKHLNNKLGLTIKKRYKRFVSKKNQNKTALNSSPHNSTGSYSTSSIFSSISSPSSIAGLINSSFSPSSSSDLVLDSNGTNFAESSSSSVSSNSSSMSTSSNVISSSSTSSPSSMTSSIQSIFADSIPSSVVSNSPSKYQIRVTHAASNEHIILDANSNLTGDAIRNKIRTLRPTWLTRDPEFVIPGQDLGTLGEHNIVLDLNKSLKHATADGRFNVRNGIIDIQIKEKTNNINEASNDPVLDSNGANKDVQMDDSKPHLKIESIDPSERKKQETESDIYECDNSVSLVDNTHSTLLSPPERSSSNSSNNSLSMSDSTSLSSSSSNSSPTSSIFSSSSSSSNPVSHSNGTDSDAQMDGLMKDYLTEREANSSSSISSSSSHSGISSMSPTSKQTSSKKKPAQQRNRAKSKKMKKEKRTAAAIKIQTSVRRFLLARKKHLKQQQATTNSSSNSNSSNMNSSSLSSDNNNPTNLIESNLATVTDPSQQHNEQVTNKEEGVNEHKPFAV